MNRILFEKNEIGDGGAFPVYDERAVHMIDILHVAVGDKVRIGIINGAAGEGEVTDVTENMVMLKPSWGNVPAMSRFSLLLALPRPKVLKRLWAVLSSLGLRRIIITNAEKVEKNYFSSHWLHPDNYRPRLLEGIVQAGDTMLPEVIIKHRFRPFVEDELDFIFPAGVRIAAHPHAEKDFNEIERRNSRDIMLAIGPEGGWNDFELELLQQHNFQLVSAGERILRTDVACVSLITLARFACYSPLF